jgi:hypothetical protein
MRTIEGSQRPEFYCTLVCLLLYACKVGNYRSPDLHYIAVAQVAGRMQGDVSSDHRTKPSKRLNQGT